MSPPGHVVTFYSYKGGVGRSFILANAAVWLARVGFRVLCMDWDLEAPGLYHFFRERGLLQPGPRVGLVDLLVALQRGETADWRRLLKDVAVPDMRGALQLLDAGDAGSSDYGRKLAALAWEESYKSPEVRLGQRLEELRAAWTADYDIVLVDSRTGLTDAGGICLAQLPDVVVAVMAPSIQGLEGALGAVETARRLRSLLPTSRGDFFALPVLSRFDSQAMGDALEKWRRIAAERLWPLCEPWCQEPVTPEQLTTLLRVPYVSRWSFGEPLPILEESTDDPTTASYAIASIAALCARRLADSRTFVADRNRYVHEVAEQNRALLGRGARQAPAYRYDVFLSFTSTQRDRAHAVAQELTVRGRRVFYDERDLLAGTAWPDGLAEGLRSARGLVALVDARPSSWQRAEVEAFLEDTRGAKDRFVLPVWFEARPDWPELFARQGFEGAGETPAQVASRIHASLAALDARKGEEDGALEPGEAKAVEEEWSGEQALAAYRAWLEEQHRRLVPYFEGAADLLLEDVCVETEVEARVDLRREGVEVRERAPGAPIPGAPIHLESLLLDTPAECRPARWLVEGEPGAGKTTLARSLARRCAKGAACLAVFVPLARVGEARLEPIEFAVADMLGTEGARSRRGRALTDALDAERRAGRLLVLLDGLDEVDPQRLDALFAEVVAWAQGDERSPLAVLTRPIAVERRDIPAEFQRARVLALRVEQQDELLRKLLGDAEAPRVRRHLDARPALSELASSPLLLTLIAVVARDTVLAETALPATRVRLYATAIDLLLRRGFGVEKKGVRDQQPARRLLQLLAWRLHDRGGEVWPRAQLSEVLTSLRRERDEANFLVKETWGTNDGFLEDVGYNSGVLGPHDGSHLPWRFLHRSIREYLAAEEMASWPRANIKEHARKWVKESEEEAKEEEDARRGPSRAHKDEPARDGPRAERWGEVYALLCVMKEEPLWILETIRAASPPMALRTLLQVEWLEGGAGLEFALSTPGWDAGLLLRLCRGWQVSHSAHQRFDFSPI